MWNRCSRGAALTYPRRRIYLRTPQRCRYYGPIPYPFPNSIPTPVNPLSSLTRSTSDVDMYMERAQALRREGQIFPDEVKLLIRRLEASLERVQGAGRRRKIAGSRYTPWEVKRQVSALRSMLLAMEVLRRTQTMPADLQERAKKQVRNAVVQL